MAEKHHHITRIDIEPSEKYPKRHPTHGWQVRVRREGNRLSKFFADARNDGSVGALEAAIVYRDELLEGLPPPAAGPRKAWSNTGVVGLSVRDKEKGKGNTVVQLNWVGADGKRKGASYSVEKWGLRQALWNGCLRLHEERGAAGMRTEEPHVMFARAQEPFAERIQEEVEVEQAEERRITREAAAEARFNAPEAKEKREEKAFDDLTRTLFGG
ncbi:MAG: AP2 domain-containing protein [Bacteroidetes bacterium]|nr:AP2 domain-containing protein [Bacteroidota bacterium]